MEQPEGKHYATSFTETKPMKRKRLLQKSDAEKSKDGEGEK